MNKEQLKAQAEALLNEKLSDEQLDGVAGGSQQENAEILTAMLGIDPQGTMDLLKTWDQRSPDAPYQLMSMVSTLILNNVSQRGIRVGFFLQPGEKGNTYYIDGKQVSHSKFMDHLSILSNVDDF